MLFRSLMPLPRGVSLLDYRNSIYKGSLGCIGLVCEWCESAIGLMAARNDKSLMPEHFSGTRFDNQLVEIAKDIKIGEEALKAVTVKKNRRKADADQTQSPEIKAKTKPFVRKPTRDPVN